jgi:hypothetical protein
MKFITLLIITLLATFISVSTLWALDVHIQWEAPSCVDQIDGYRVYYGESQGGPYPNQLCEVNATTLNCPVTLDNAQGYYIICRSFNNYCESIDSNEVHWDYTIPGPPGNLIWSIDLVEVMKNIGADRIKFVSE